MVPCKGTWKMEGIADELEVNIPCKGDKYATVDSYIGKATRKFLKRIYEQATGALGPADGDVDSDYVDVEAAKALPPG